jgi:penicillin-binding protein 2
MANLHAIKDLHLEQRLFGNRVLIAGILVSLLLMLVLGRLVYLQIVNYKYFTTQSQNNRVRLVAVPPPRGLVYDRNGVILAENLPSYQLEITPEQVEDLDATLAGLSSVITLTENEIDRFGKALRRKRPFERIPLKFNLSDEDVARFAVSRHQFPGVDINARLTRYYPMGGTAVHALGYVGRIDERDLQRVDADNYNGTSHIGKLGIEREYEALLHGQVGYQREEVNAEGRTLTVLEREPPRPGFDIVLSLDAGLQRLAEKELAGYNGAVVAIDPRNGEVLALASMPTYDPNLFVNGISTRDYAELNTGRARPLFNRALKGQYPPGSTIKPLVGLAGLEYQVTWPGKEMYAGPFYMLPNDERKYRDWKPEGHGVVDLDVSITQSCDVYFYDLAYKLGIDRIHSFLYEFGLGQATGIDVPGEEDGLLPSREWKQRARRMPWFPGETLIVGIGQGYMLTTPMQMAEFTSILAMRGERMRPRLLKAVRDPASGEQTLMDPEPRGRVQVRDERLWRYVIEPMEHVMHQRNGTAYWTAGHDAPYRIAGKTGTAQVFGLGADEEYEEENIAQHLRDHSLFVGFAPADDPRIAVAVIAENGGSGSKVAAPIARRLMDFYLLREAEKDEEKLADAR